MLDRARDTLDRALEGLDRANVMVTQRLADLEAAGEYDEKLGSHLAWSAAKVAEITSALRQLEKHDRTQSRTPEQRFKIILEWARCEATPVMRAELAALLASLDTEQRVLS